jgi:mRNA-degrading endonuclease RelE of RelBE toxin-antitoxin system
MSILWTDKFKRNYQRLPVSIRKKFQKQLTFLLDNLRHSSLRVKKMKGRENVWEARVDRFYRFTFQKDKENIILRTIGPHDEALKD